MVAPALILLWSDSFAHVGRQPLASRLPRGLADFLSILSVIGFFSPPLVGACVFLADQSRYRFRFLAERGISPRTIWLSRQLVWGSALLLAILVFCVPLVYRVVFAWGFFHEVTPESILPLFISLGVILLAYACGQFCSMFIHSGILAVMASLLLTVLLVLWANLMWFLGMNLAWSVAPLPVAFFVATWLKPPDWLEERSGWMSRLRAVAPVAVPVIAILIAVPLIRAYQIPMVDPGFSPSEFTRPATPEEEATAALYAKAEAEYREAWQKVRERRISDEKAMNAALLKEKDAEEALSLTLEASKHRVAPSLSINGQTDINIRVLTSLLILSAGQLESEGRLDAALDRCLAAIRLLGQLEAQTV